MQFQGTDIYLYRHILCLLDKSSQKLGVVLHWVSIYQDEEKEDDEEEEEE